MRWSTVSLFSILGFLAIAPATQADQDYGILIISRERLEVATSCEIGIARHRRTSLRSARAHITTASALIRRVACRQKNKRLARTPLDNLWRGFHIGTHFADLYLRDQVGVVGDVGIDLL